jgi:ribosome-associated toxin RatA of RatAB toxin-antitoxin module
MKELRGMASSAVDAPAEQCIALVADVEHYRSWHSDVVREVEVLERDEQGAVTKARTKLRVAIGGLGRDFELTLATSAPRPGTVKLTRLPHDAADREELEMLWEVQEGRIQLRMEARLDVPRLLPTGGLGDVIARGFVEDAARALQS